MPCREIIQRFAKRQANSTTNNAPQNSIGECFTGNHFRHLPFIHSYCPHSSILLHSGRHTHGNAIDNVHYRYQCNNCQKRINTENKSHISSRSALVAFISKAICLIYGILDCLNIFVRNISRCLYQHKRITFLSCQTDKCFIRGNQCELSIGAVQGTNQVTFNLSNT